MARLNPTASRFRERAGGEIVGPSGQPVVWIEVNNLRTGEAMRVTRAVIAALEAEFPPRQGKGGVVEDRGTE